ncbi:MAG TPA: DUF4157 domain-containing protein [Longimicrobium sp.]|nr:DUF4157 domain-containing protein [Longimicrobium sp.]
MSRSTFAPRTRPAPTTAKPPAPASPLLAQRAASPHETAATPGPARRTGQADGVPLAADLRSHFGARFGHDFGDVRVHRGPEAERAAEAQGAAAFAFGRNLVFGRGQYAPGTLAGRRLIAHELAHVVQQRPGARGAAETPALEAAAHRASYAALSGAGTVAVEGRAAAGVARMPDSLRGSLDVEHAAPAEIEAKIREIRAVLRGGGESLSMADRLLLDRELDHLEDHRFKVRTGVDVEDFALAFNQEFRNVLHAFAPMPALPGATHAKAPTGAALTTRQLRELFTPFQMHQLMNFMSTRRIPERLFNDTDPGRANAQQRLLMSAHILATGTYDPGSVEQKVHAQMCWHWVHIVHHYAGATTPVLNTGVMGGFDPQGGAVIGKGTLRGRFHGERVFAPDLPA